MCLVALLNLYVVKINFMSSIQGQEQQSVDSTH